MLSFGQAWARGTLFDDPATHELMRHRFHTFGLPTSMAVLRAPSWPIEYSRGVMRFAPSRMAAGGRRIPPLLGHTGATGSWMWHVPDLGIVVAGTVDQSNAIAVPFRLVPRAPIGARLTTEIQSPWPVRHVVTHAGSAAARGSRFR